MSSCYAENAAWIDTIVAVQIVEVEGRGEMKNSRIKISFHVAFTFC